jgi:hypothetical protein
VNRKKKEKFNRALALTPNTIYMRALHLELFTKPSLRSLFTRSAAIVYV